MLHKNTNRWLPYLSQVTFALNHSWHRMIKARPVDVTQQNTEQIRQNLFPEGTLPTRKIKWRHNIGDQVRISRALGVFSKGFDPQFTEEVKKKIDSSLFNVVILRFLL